MEQSIPTHGGQFSPLQKEQIKSIHNASLRLLSETGLAVSPELMELLSRYKTDGWTLDSKSGRIRFSPDQVETALDFAPNAVSLYGRNGDQLDLVDDNVYFGTGGTPTQVIDIETGDCRSGTLQDLRQFVRLVDDLANIDLLVRPLTPVDIPSEHLDVNIVFAGLSRTAKHFNCGVFDPDRFGEVFDLVSTVAGSAEELRSRPFFSIHASVGLSPLKLSTGPIKLMIKAVQERIPVTVSSAPMAGSTAPITLAGTLAMLHAEVLAGIVITQCVAPGSPIIYTATPARADMRNMRYASGAVETAMLAAAAHQLARHVNLPNFCSGGWTDAKIPDAQAGWEGGIGSLIAALGGGNCIRHHAGLLDSVMTLSFEMAVMNDEMAGMIRRCLRGITVDEEHIALDVIQAIGPGGEYLTAAHTVKHLRSEFYMGRGLSDRTILSSWKERGSMDAFSRANALVKEILSKPETCYLDGRVIERIKSRHTIID